MHFTAVRHATKLLGRAQVSALWASRDGLQSLSTSTSVDLFKCAPVVLSHINPFHTFPAPGKNEGSSSSEHPSGSHVKDNKPAPKSGQATGYGSSQVESDRTGDKPQTAPKPTEHGTVPRPGPPTNDDSSGQDPDKKRPRTGTTGGDPNESLTPGQMPPGYDKNKPRPATPTEQGATDEMQGKNQGMGHLGSDPTKDTGGAKPDYGNADPQKDEEDLMQGGNRRVEQGRAGNLHKVDTGEAAGMPKDAKPPSSSPAEHHEGKRAAKGPAGSGDSWDPSSDTPSLDKGARVTDPRTPREERSDLSPTDGPPGGSPQPGSYAEELTQNVRVGETPDGPQEMPPKVPSAVNPQQPKGD